MHTPPNCTRRATLVTRSSSSPRRRSSLPSSQTPRRGEKQKRQRRGHNAQHDVINGATLPNAIDLSVAIDDRSTRRTLSSNHRRTTDFLGWRRLHFDEIVSVRVRQSIIVVIPTDVRSDDDLIKKQRKLFKRRLVGHIASGFNDLCRDEVVAHLNEHHGVERNDSIYIELVCSVKAYGERDELMAGQNLEWHLGRGNSGMLLDLNDFPSEKSLQIKPAELPSVQFWVEHYRGDLRPQVQLKQKRVLHNFCDPLLDLLDEVKDDPLQTLELALEFEKKRSMILVKDIKKANASAASRKVSSEEEQLADFKLALDDELDHNNLKNFAVATDLRYKEAFYEAYSTFRKRGCLLSEDVTGKIMSDLVKYFPLHFQAFKSLIFTKRNLRPSNQEKPLYLRKCKSLVNHVCALVRIRNPKRLTHWAAVATMAMWKRGMAQRVSRNPVIKAFSIIPTVAFSMLDKIYGETEPERRQLLALQQICSHSSDNYNQYHAHSIQVSNKAGIMHLGMVFNAVRCKEWNKPVGTIYLDPERKLWVVVSSRLASDFVCSVSLWGKRTDGNQQQSLATQQVNMPCIGWTIKYLPGVPVRPPPITYVNQEIPAALTMVLPAELLPCQVIMQDRDWSSLHDTTWRNMNPREYLKWVGASRRIDEMLLHVKSRDAVDQEIGEDEKLVSVLQTILEENKQIHANVRNFQKDMNEKFNETYNAQDEFIWPPVSPREEMKNEQALLAMVNIFDELGMINKIADGKYAISETAAQRWIFQGGDVLTIKKWYSLAYLVLQQMTAIGKEDYVGMMMKVYKRFIKFHDYLHENIHRLQVIYKFFYGGLIQPIQVLLGTKKVKLDPTKGSWKTHEWLVIKILYASRSLRTKIFMKTLGDDIINDISSGTLSPEEGLWKLQEMYEDFIIHTEHSSCDLTRCVALFSNIADRWHMCREAVPLGDGFVLEIEGCDWLPIWAAASKAQYLLEGKRRIETMYELKPWLLQYLRCNHFVRLTKDGRLISLDDLCEKQNISVKDCPKDSNFESVCDRSKHTLMMELCALEFFGPNQRTHSMIPNLKEDVKRIVELFERMGIFENMDEQRRLHDNSFWEHIIERKVGRGNEKDRKKEYVEMSHHERVAFEILTNKPAVDLPSTNEDELDAVYGNEDQTNCGEEDSLSDDFSARTHHSLASWESVGIDESGEGNDLTLMLGENDTDIVGNLDVVRQEEKKLKEKKEQEAALTRLGGVTRYKVNLECLKNQFVVGTNKLANVVAERKVEIAKENKKLELIYDAVNHFKKKMKANVAQLDTIIEETMDEGPREEEDWSMTLRSLRETFDEQAYQNTNL